MALFALQQWHQLNLLVDFWCISKLSVWGVFRDLEGIMATAADRVELTTDKDKSLLKLNNQDTLNMKL